MSNEGPLSKKFVDFCSGDLTVSVKDVLEGLSLANCYSVSVGQDNWVVICINHERAGEISERVSEMIDYFDDQAEAEEVAE